MEFNAESGQKLAETIDKRIIEVSKQLYNNSGRDKTIYGVVTKANSGIFSIKVNNTEYHNVLALRNVGNIKVGEKVTCLVPNGNYSDMVILGVADGTIKSGDDPSGHVYDGQLTIQRNGTTVGTFTANSQTDKTINISVPTTASEVGALPDSTLYGASIDFSFDGTTYVATVQLKDQNGSNLSSAKTITLPFSGVVVGGSFNSSTKMIALETMSGQLINFSIADLLTQVESDITDLQNNKLDKTAVITPQEVDALFVEPSGGYMVTFADATGSERANVANGYIQYSTDSGTTWSACPLNSSSLSNIEKIRFKWNVGVDFVSIALTNTHAYGQTLARGSSAETVDYTLSDDTTYYCYYEYD